MEYEGTTFNQYKLIAIGLLKQRCRMDEETAKEHLENIESFYKKCYDNDMEVGKAVSEDIRHWED